MRDNEESTGTRHFVAFTPRLKMNWIVAVILGVLVVDATVIIWVNTALATALAREVVHGVIILSLVAYGGFLAFAFTPQKIRISLTGDVVTVSRRTSDAFALANAKLGRWTVPSYGTMQGTALHLGSSRHQFVLGGRDHRIAAETRFEAPPVRSVDAYMSAADFDALLGFAYCRGASNGRAAAVPEPIRCLLVPNSARLLARVRLTRAGRPSIAIELGPDMINVIDAKTSARITSAPLSQVSATPATHTYGGRVSYTMPVLVVRVPGVKPLSVGIPDFRFSWRCKAPSLPAPRFVASGTDWPTLVEKFGVGSVLQVSSE